MKKSEAFASKKAFSSMTLEELLDRRNPIHNNYYQHERGGIPHQKKTIEKMQRGEEGVCRLTKAGTSCQCLDANLSVYGRLLREIDAEIDTRINPVVPRLARAQRERLWKQAGGFNEKASRLENDARDLRKQAADLIEQSKSDAERAVDAIEANGGDFFESADDAHRVTVANRTALVGFGACGCCLRLFYEEVFNPSYAPRVGDQVACHAACGEMGQRWIFDGKKWRGRFGMLGKGKAK